MSIARISSIPISGSSTVKSQYTVKTTDLGNTVTNRVHVKSSGFDGIDSSANPISCKSNLPTSQEEFEGSSWEDLAGLEGDLSSLVGFTKDVKMTGYGTQKFQVVDTDCYDKVTGGKSKLVFLSVDCLKESLMRFGEKATKTSDRFIVYHNSDVKTYCDENVLNSFPEDLLSIIAEIKLPCFNYPYVFQSNKCPELEYLNEKVFIPSVAEMCSKENTTYWGTGAPNYYYPTEGNFEGKQYKYYQIHNEWEDKLKNYLGTKDTYGWWLRSPQVDRENFIRNTECEFICIWKTSISSQDCWDASHPLVVAFCI